MKQRKVHVPAVVDWHWMGQTGLMEGIEPYLDKAYNSILGSFVCMGWTRLFEIQEVVYKELVIEFLNTVLLHGRTKYLLKTTFIFDLVEKVVL